MYIKSIIFLFCTTFAYSQDYTYLLEDINTSSDYYGDYVSPPEFNGQVTLHYFGHQNWGTCSARVGNLNSLYNDLLDQGINNVKIIAIGKSQYQNYNDNWINNNDIPIVLDSSPYVIWQDWNAGQRDLFFLDSAGNYSTHFNITTWNYDNVYDAILGLLPEDSTCDEIQNSYESIHTNSEYTNCNYDNDCLAVWGHCDIGLGGCHYAINSEYPQYEVNDLAEQWLDGDCMEWVCDCMELPYAQCLDGTCSPAYCMGENPAGCFETGCDEGYECIVTEDDCIPSSCFCDESTFYGSWFCTEDCGGGICQPIQLGDINNDGTVNVIDVVYLVNMVLSNDNNSSGDINNDGFINVIDVVMLVNMILE